MTGSSGGASRMTKCRWLSSELLDELLHPVGAEELGGVGRGHARREDLQTGHVGVLEGIGQCDRAGEHLGEPHGPVGSKARATAERRRSASMSTTCSPDSARTLARLAATVDLPSPWLALMATIERGWLSTSTKRRLVRS